MAASAPGPKNWCPAPARVISVRMDYLAEDTLPLEVLAAPTKPIFPLMRWGATTTSYRANAWQRWQDASHNWRGRPVPGLCRQRAGAGAALSREKRAGMGWIAKNTMLINADAGSWFFLGEIYTDLPLPADIPQATNTAALCTACLDICPTDAFTGPFQLDAQMYFLPDHRAQGSIDPALRPLMGNRVFGCDDCQLVCPGTSLPRSPRKAILRRATGWRMPIWLNCSCGMRRPTWPTPRVPPSVASATNAGCATWL